MRRTSFPLMGLIMFLALGAGGLVLAIPKSPSPGEEAGVPPGAASGHSNMTNTRLGELIKRIDPDAQGQPGNWSFTVQDIPAFVITDEEADRMRILVPAADADDLDQATLYRILQANFESALDARYAIAQNTVWSAFIHPLSHLSEEEFFSAVAQTFNAALTFGGSYSSGVFQFGGGDNRSDIYDEVIEKGRQL
ncbi:MAG: hypothetical protein AAF541_15540 [Pseudomonadota bacterium]